MTSPNLLLFNFQGFGYNPLQLTRKKPNQDMSLKRYNSELILQLELEELERLQQKKSSGVHRLWDHIKTAALPNVRSYIHRELLGREEWEEKCSSYLAFMKNLGSKRKRTPSDVDVLWDHPSHESERLLQDTHGVSWRTWGPYVSERQWGTVREDYSVDGNW